MVGIGKSPQIRNDARKTTIVLVIRESHLPYAGDQLQRCAVLQHVPAATRRTGGHPAKRTFQALRIEVNDELAVLDSALPAAVDALRVGGRVAVLSYHSIEDRMVKRVLAAGAASSAPPDLPVVPESAQPTLRLLTRGAETPDDDEVASNPRAASARLRAAERIREAA